MPRFREALHKKMCATLEPGDGCDPRYDKKEHGSPPNRKALQLCAQVFKTLVMSLPGCGDNILNDLTVESVTLAPDSSQLLVTLKGDVDLNDAEQSLAAVQGKLRTEVAQSIHRRKTPKLLFKIVR